MCGRFAQHSTRETLIRHFAIETVTCDVTPAYNIAPTQEVLAVIARRERRLGKLRWGLIPPWAGDMSGTARLINARAETVAQKPVFRSAFKARRCLIPADGYYEWQKGESGRQPFYFTRPSGEPLAFAGLWETWKRRDGAVVCHSCAFLTTEADRSVREIHPRMPVMLLPAVYDMWLHPGNDPLKELWQILADGCIRDLTYYPVSRRVNSVKNNDEACLARL
ncbi:SOS response-associated peptidase [Desulfonema ishimotonii]|uniref:Abasic site processing protein n=1 Tax=Desulfonema ishimotonii TaxID=45657 RepID=A0A401FYM5_9BACT|nr:SOS response-associated peptidase [Desulfonema ishimotonii]GBC62102.1 SOS response-associated peptidase [Desulfonema ishimotonii]